MKPYTLIAIALTLTLTLPLTQTNTLLALEHNPKFGKPTQEELEMTQYDPDPEADAVVLYNTCDAQYTITAAADFRIIYRHKVRIKVLKPEGTSQANVEITFVDPEESGSAKEIISGLKASSYNLEGGKVVRTKMNGDMKSEERIDKYRSRQKFAVPNVKVGTVIEYEYECQSDYFFSPDTWYAQTDIPVFYTDYTISIPDWFQFRDSFTGQCQLERKADQDNFSVFVQGQQLSTATKRLTYVGNCLPALKDDPFIHCMEDYCTKVNFDISGISIPGSVYKSYNHSWTDIAYSLYEDDDFGKRYELKNPLAEQQKALSLDDMDLRKKVSALRTLLLQNYKWNDSFSFWGVSSRKAAKEDELNAGSLNFILMSMMRDAGIEALPVVMSRRSKGRLPFFPTASAFNAMVLQVAETDSTWFYVDACDDDYPVGSLNTDLLVDRAMRIGTKSAQMVNVADACSGKSQTNIVAQISADGVLSGTMQAVCRDEDAAYFRKAFRAAQDSTRFIEEMATRYNVEYDSYEVNGQRGGAERVDERITFHRNLEVAGDMIYVNPFLFIDATSPFTEEKRDLPVEFDYNKSLRAGISLRLPEGYAVEEMPKNRLLQSPDKSITCRIATRLKDGTITINYNFARKAMLYAATDYELLRSIHADIEAACGEMIVLKKAQQ